MFPVGKIEIVDWCPEWPESFRRKASAIRSALGDHALRIDHIGSTSIQGLAAKPIIDIQVSVATFEPIETLTEPLWEIGYEWRQANSELTKRYFRERPGGERTHIHIRRLGSWHEQWALLFRDYMSTAGNSSWRNDTIAVLISSIRTMQTRWFRWAACSRGAASSKKPCPPRVGARSLQPAGLVAASVFRRKPNLPETLCPGK